MRPVSLSFCHFSFCHSVFLSFSCLVPCAWLGRAGLSRSLCFLCQSVGVQPCPAQCIQISRRGLSSRENNKYNDNKDDDNKSNENEDNEDNKDKKENQENFLCQSVGVQPCPAQCIQISRRGLSSRENNKYNDNKDDDNKSNENEDNEDNKDKKKTKKTSCVSQWASTLPCPVCSNQREATFFKKKTKFVQYEITAIRAMLAGGLRIAWLKFSG